MGDNRLVPVGRLKWEKVGDHWEAPGIAGVYTLTGWLEWSTYWVEKASRDAGFVATPFIVNAEMCVIGFRPISGRTMAPASVNGLDAGKQVCEAHNRLMMNHVAGKLRAREGSDG